VSDVDSPIRAGGRWSSGGSRTPWWTPTVGHPGGRPDLSDQALASYLARLAGAGVTRR